jgi:hypothetical protein
MNILLTIAQFLGTVWRRAKSAASEVWKVAEFPFRRRKCGCCK